MDLTPEEKERIYQEEKIRHEAQEKIKQEQAEKEKTKKAAETKQAWIGCLGVLGVLVVVIVLMSSGWCDISKDYRPKDAPSSSSTVDLKAKTYFSGGQFTIDNLESFDWTNVEVEINSRPGTRGYKLTVPLIKAGEAYSVGAMVFAKDDGTRFNPFTIKAQTITIYCDTPSGKGFYYGEWK